MSIPHIYFGQRTEGVLLELDRDTFVDHGSNAYRLFAKTNRYAPAGAGGEALFTALYVTVTHFAQAIVYVTPFVDGVVLQSQRIALPSAMGATTAVRKLVMSVPIVVDGIVMGRSYARGTWLQVLVETRNDVEDVPPSRLIIENVECEREIVREGRAASGELVE